MFGLVPIHAARPKEMGEWGGSLTELNLENATIVKDKVTLKYIILNRIILKRIIATKQQKILHA
jgi:hypothetical protein